MREIFPPYSIRKASGIHRLAHGNSYVSIGPVVNIGKGPVIEAVLDVVGALFELNDEYIHAKCTSCKMQILFFSRMKTMFN